MKNNFKNTNSLKALPLGKGWDGIIYNIAIIALLFTSFMHAQQKQDSTKVFKKRVLETAEVDLLMSYYGQNGENAAVTGGIGTEKLDDFATNITVTIPLNADDVLTVDGTISAYTSASSSNLNPFSGASRGGDDDDDDKREGDSSSITGTPWAASSGASKSDVWLDGIIGFQHSSDNRNRIWGANVSVANEFDYFSFGVGVNRTWLFNQQNTEIAIKGNVFLDQWRPVYPTEIKSYQQSNGNLNYGFFSGVNILDQNGNRINKNSPTVWKPYNNELVINKGRNSYTGSISFSQILTKKMQISFFADIVQQNGWLSNPMQRVYFKDRPNFYIGKAYDIPRYTSTKNQGVFQLADDIERLPNSRIKFPLGMRLSYYINEFLVLKTYYRYYFDDWGITSQTANIELPIKIADKFTLYPNYRYYTQTQADYFAPYETHLTTEKFYTSDYDLSAFNSNQYGFGVRYTDIFAKGSIFNLFLKQADLKYSYYKRNTNFHFNIVSLGFKFITK